MASLNLNLSAKPALIATLRDAGLDDRWQLVEERIERLSVEGKEAADEPGRSRSVSPKVDEEGQLAAGLLAWRLLGDPRGLGHDVEERGAGKPDRSQHIGKRVCTHRTLSAGRPVYPDAWSMPLQSRTRCQALQTSDHSR